MLRLYGLCLALTLCVSSAIAQDTATVSPFVGTWRLNPARSKLTDVMKVQGLGGPSYAINFGSGTETLNVDGTEHPGNFGTMLSIAAEGPNQWKVVRKRNGHVMLIALWTLSPEAGTLTDHYTAYSAEGSPGLAVDYVYKRNGPGERFTGEWVSISEAPKSVITMQVQTYEGDGLSFLDSSTRTMRAARFDGKDYKVTGPNANPEAVCSLRKIDEHNLELSFKVPGRTLYILQIQLSPDLKTMTITRHITGISETNIQVFERDPSM